MGSLTVSTPGDDTANEYILPYSSFTGTCDFSNVGALEIFIIMNDNIDVLLSDWSTYGPIVECTCFCPAFTCQLLLDPDDDYFSYYLTSQFGNYGNPNPTTDLSTLFLMVQDSTIQPPIFPQSTLVEQFSSILMTMITSSLTLISVLILAIQAEHQEILPILLDSAVMIPLLMLP